MNRKLKISLIVISAIAVVGSSFGYAYLKSGRSWSNLKDKIVGLFNPYEATPEDDYLNRRIEKDSGDSSNLMPGVVNKGKLSNKTRETIGQEILDSEQKQEQGRDNGGDTPDRDKRKDDRKTLSDGQWIHWLEFRKKLRNFLWEYDARHRYWSYYAAGHKCIRTNENQNPIVCLSGGKINDIIMQLNDPNRDGDNSDQYFRIQDPTERRQYLLSTPRQSFVMSKVVMLFEEGTRYRVYTSENPPDQNFKSADLRLDYMTQKIFDNVIYPIPLIGDFSKILLGDSKLRALAFGSEPIQFGVYRWYVKPKSQIEPEDLDKIYTIDRMDQFSSFRDRTEWTTQELEALNPMLEDLNKAVNYAKEKGMKPVQAQVLVDSVEMGSLMLPGFGVSSKGMILAEGFVPRSLVKTVIIGSESFDLEIPRLWSVFKASRGSTRFDFVTSSVGKIEEAANMLSRIHRNRLNDIDQLLIDLFREDDRLFICDTDYIERMWHGSVWRPVGWYDFEYMSIHYDDVIFMSKHHGETTLHEMIHYLRDMVRKRKFPGITDPRWFEEAMTSWTAVETAARNGQRVIAGSHLDTRGYYSRKFINDIADQIASKNGISFEKGKDMLLNVEFMEPYPIIDDLLGRPNFVNDLNDKFLSYELEAIGAVQKGDPQRMRDAVNKAQEIRRFIRGEGI